jgi:HEXXH motif-containing protein
MNDLPVHRIPAATFATLAAGGGGRSAVEILATAQRSKHALLVRQVVEMAGTAGHPQSELTREAFASLAAIEEMSRPAVAAVLSHPPVGAWAQRTVRLLSAPATMSSAAPAQLGSLAAAAAIRGGADCRVDVPVSGASVILPSVGLITGASPASLIRITVHNGHATAAARGWEVEIPSDPAQDSPGWQGLHSLSATWGPSTLTVCLEDLDPDRGHDPDSLAGRLSRAELPSWSGPLAAAWELLVRHHETVADEVATGIRAFTPLRRPPHGSLSSTSRETFGSIALSPPADGGALAVTLAHEIQHAKLSALLDVVPMVSPDDGTRYYAPWRDDPRPLAGLMQGAYAFLGVAGFWRRQCAVTGDRAMSAGVEFARWRAAVRLVIETMLASGRLTEPGQLFVAGMAETLSEWVAEPVSPEAAARARRISAQHRSRWARNHGEPGPGPAVPVTGASRPVAK